MEKIKWFVAFVGHNTEKISRDRLEQLGYEAFVATQNERHNWKNGKSSNVEVVVISNLVFVHCTEQQRKEVVNLPFIKFFLTDRACRPNKFGIHPIAEIPEREMEMLRFMLFKADSPVRFEQADLKMGDTVRVVRGNLAGLEGQVVQLSNSNDHWVGIRIGNLA